MHRPRFLADDAWIEAGGIAWYAHRRGETICIQHGGAISGFKANVCFDPTYRVGSIVLLNGEIDASLLSMDLAMIALEAVGAAGGNAEPRVPVPEEFRELLGVYLDPGSGWLVRLEWVEGSLRIVDPATPTWRPTLVPTAEKDVFTVELGVREAGEPANFHRLPDGRVSSMFVASQTWMRLDPLS